MNVSKLEFSNKVFKISGDWQLLTRPTTKVTTGDPLGTALGLTGLPELKRTAGPAGAADEPHSPSPGPARAGRNCGFSLPDPFFRKDHKATN